MYLKIWILHDDDWRDIAGYLRKLLLIYAQTTQNIKSISRLRENL